MTIGFLSFRFVQDICQISQRNWLLRAKRTVAASELVSSLQISISSILPLLKMQRSIPSYLLFRYAPPPPPQKKKKKKKKKEKKKKKNTQKKEQEKKEQNTTKKQQQKKKKQRKKSKQQKTRSKTDISRSMIFI